MSCWSKMEARNPDPVSGMVAIKVSRPNRVPSLEARGRLWVLLVRLTFAIPKRSMAASIAIIDTIRNISLCVPSEQFAQLSEPCEGVDKDDAAYNSGCDGEHYLEVGTILEALSE